MRIGEPIESFTGQRAKYLPIKEALGKLPDGKSLPVTFDEEKDVEGIKQFVYTMNRDGVRYRVNRRDMTVFITRVHLNGQP